jgi:FMN-dependent NADH-azoreductase
MEGNTMINVLRIDASPRQSRSLSRALADTFVEALAQQDEARIVRRDLASTDLGFVDEEWIAAAFTPEGERTPEEHSALALSDKLIDELASADLLVIATPMYNYGMPAALKAWVDQVVRIGKTFTFDLARGDFPLEPILAGKTIVLLTSRGEFGFEPGGIRQGQDHLVPPFATIAKYLGADRLEHIGIEYQEFGGERHEASVRSAHEHASALAGRLALGRSERLAAKRYLRPSEDGAANPASRRL